MAQFFGFDSVRDFAEEIWRTIQSRDWADYRASTARRALNLRTSSERPFLNPSSQSHPPHHHLRLKPDKDLPQKAHPNSPLKPQVEVPTLEVEDGRKTSKKKKVGETETSEVHCSADLTNNKVKMSSTDKFSSSTSGHVPQRSCGPVEESKTNIATSSQPFKDKEHLIRSSCVSTEGCVASSSTQTSSSSQITDLIGDTSILDDLFKSKRKTVDQARDVKASTCTERAKSKGKDFWDILNEGNEEILTNSQIWQRWRRSATVPVSLRSLGVIRKLKARSFGNKMRNFSGNDSF